MSINPVFCTTSAPTRLCHCYISSVWIKKTKLTYKTSGWLRRASKLTKFVSQAIQKVMWLAEVCIISVVQPSCYTMLCRLSDFGEDVFLTYQRKARRQGWPLPSEAVISWGGDWTAAWTFLLYANIPHRIKIQHISQLGKLFQSFRLETAACCEKCLQVSPFVRISFKISPHMLA